MTKALVLDTIMNQVNFAGLMMGSSELRDFFLMTLREADLSWLDFIRRLDDMVKTEEITTFDHAQIMDHLRDNMNSQFMPWPYFQYAMKALGAKSIKIVIE